MGEASWLNTDLSEKIRLWRGGFLYARRKKIGLVVFPDWGSDGAKLALKRADATVAISNTNTIPEAFSARQELEIEVREVFVRAAQMIGVPKSVGEIYGLLYLSE